MTRGFTSYSVHLEAQAAASPFDNFRVEHQVNRDIEPWQANAYMAGQRYITQSLDQGQQAPRPVREVLVTEREARVVNGELVIREREVYIVEGDSNQSWPTQ